MLLLLMNKIVKLQVTPLHIFLIITLTGNILNIMNHPDFNEEIEILLSKSKNRPLFTWNLKTVIANKNTAAFIISVNIIFATFNIRVSFQR